MPTRRQALKTLAATAIASTALGNFPTFAQVHVPSLTPTAGPFKLPPLPYDYNALEPTIDTETMHLHHDKHHAAYVNKLNEALAKEPSFVVAPGTNIDELLKNLSTVPDSIRTAVRNQGGGHANHSLFWQTLGPKGGQPSDTLTKAINSDFGSLDNLKAEMGKLGAGLFGSGWVWVVLDGGKKLTLLALPNQDSPLIEGHFPLFGIDVWEHAYYLKYHNLRTDYLNAIWNVINWDFISKRYDDAMK
jgi:Fe-Mn family superoxide dismutase